MNPLHVHDHAMEFRDRRHPLRATYICACGLSTNSLEEAICQIRRSRERRSRVLLYGAFAAALAFTVWVMP